MKLAGYIFLSILFFSCDNPSSITKNIVTSDIPHFWKAYDEIIATKDSTFQYQLLDSLYFQKGTVGLKAIREARNYSPKDYIDAINNYPKFWASVRQNTLKADTYANELQQGIEKLKQLYPSLKPAKMYFTIGALRTNGTTLDSLVLIGSELAMTDKTTVSSEFPEPLNRGRRAFFDRNPIENLVLLNVHEYVHTQQKPALENLLSFSIREGVAEFVSSKALGVPSSTPAVTFGKNNDAVRQKFERELFYGNNLYQWLWSDSPNEFGVRDLGYYIGYELSERYYNQSKDKNEAIKNLIELNYTNENEIESFVNSTGFFSDTIENLYQEYESRRPTVIAIQPFQNNSEKVNPKTNQITVIFSEPMNEEFRNFDYGPLGEEAVVRFKKLIGYSVDGTSLTFEIEPLEPNKHYQLLIGWGFRNINNVPLKPYLIDFKTAK